MDLIFGCSNCRQQLEADASMAGNEIECPACKAKIIIPQPDPANTRVHGAMASSAAAKEEYHFSVPVHDHPSEVLIEKPKPPLEAAAKLAADKRIRVKCIRRTDCVEVGKDRFDEIVSDYLADIGETNIISITPISYTHLDLSSRQMMTDFGIMIVFRG